MVRLHPSVNAKVRYSLDDFTIYELCQTNDSQVFANNQSDDKIFSLTVAEIADAQGSDSKWKSSLMRMIPNGKFIQ